MPGTRQATLWCEDSILQWSPVVCAIGVQGVYLMIDLDQQDLSSLNALDFCLDLVQVI